MKANYVDCFILLTESVWTEVTCILESRLAEWVMGNSFVSGNILLLVGFIGLYDWHMCTVATHKLYCNFESVFKGDPCKSDFKAF